MAIKGRNSREMSFSKLSNYMGEMTFRYCEPIRNFKEGNKIVGYGVVIFSDEKDDLFMVSMDVDPSAFFKKRDVVDFTNAVYMIQAKGKGSAQFVGAEVADLIVADEIILVKNGMTFNAKTGEIKDAEMQKAASTFNATSDFKNDQIKK